MTSPARLTFPFFLLAALTVLFSVLLAMPWTARAQSVPTLEIADVSASEGEGALEFTVGFAGGATSAQAVTVDYATADGDALAGNDYIGTTGTLTIPSGDSSDVVTVTVNNDKVREIDETFTLTLSNPSNAALPGGAVTVTGTILDNERPYVSVKALQSDIFATEPVVVEFTRLGSAENRLSFSFRYDHMTADGSDFLTNLGISLNNTRSHLSFAPGKRKVEWRLDPVIRPEEQFTFQVLVKRLVGNDDFAFDRTPARVLVHRRPVHRSLDIPDPDGTLPAVSIAAGSGGEGGVPTVAEGQEATFTLTRGGDTSEQLTVWVHTEEPHHPDWTPDDEKNPSAGFKLVRFSPGSGTATLTVDIEDDGVAEDADWLEAVVSPLDVSLFRKGTPHRAYVNIIDDDEVDYRETVSLRDIYDETIFDEGVPISLRSQRDTLSDRGSFKPLTYRILVTQDGSGVPEDWVGIITPVHRRYVEDRVQNTPVPTLTNDGDESTTRVTFTLLESPYYRIDPDYASITVRVRDLDPAPVLEIDSATAPKGAETFDFRVSFADDVSSLRNVTVDYRTEDGKATAGQDYTETSGTLTIPAGETGGVISVPLLENRFAQAGSKFKMHIEDPSNASLASSEPATATLNYRPIVELTARHLAIETGETATFDLTRDGTPASELTVKVFASENNGRGGDVEGRGDHYATFAAGASTTVLDIEDVASISNPEHFLKVKVYQNSGLYENGDDDVAFVKVYDQLTYVTVAVDHETVVEGDIGDGEGKDAIFDSLVKSLCRPN